MDLKGRKVKMFRCHIDPMIPPRPANAFMVTDPASPIAEAVLGDIAVCVTLKKDGAVHVVPYSNVQSITLMPEEPTDEIKEVKAHPMVKVAEHLERILMRLEADAISEPIHKAKPIPKPRPEVTQILNK